jgi:hypothetical protein
VRDTTGTLPWWLEPGEELCEHCLIVYRYEAGFRCAECDGPFCPSCLARVTISAEIVCPACGPAASPAPAAGVEPEQG